MKKTVWVADLETTTEVDYLAEGRVRCYLWHARRISPDGMDYPPEEMMGYDIGSFIEACRSMTEVWFYNLKFDGSFILDAVVRSGEWEWGEKQDRKRMTYSHLITDLGQWMSLTLRFGNHVCTIKDAAKKFPGFSLEQVAELYKIPGKTELDVYVRRPEDWTVTETEKERVKGDTRILATAMEDLLQRGMKGLTMASDAMADFKRIYAKKWGTNWERRWKWDYPTFTLEEDEWMRAAYKGGYVFVDPRYEGRNIGPVRVIDVNSMYPWAMYFCRLPYGKGVRRKPRPGEIYIVRFNARFDLKKGKLPTIQAKHNLRYTESEYLTSSDGEFMQLTMTSVDYELMHDHYNVHYEYGHEWVVFRSRTGDYREYIDKWMSIKEEASRNHDKATKSIAKRYLNSLYGKNGERMERTKKISFFDEDNDRIGWDEVTEITDGRYLPHAIFITAYARDNIIRTAQRFKDKGRFVYCDTDSVHFVGEGIPDGVDIDQARLGAWKVESESYAGRYIGPKKYIHIGVREEGELVSWKEIACAGAPNRCKENMTWRNFRIGGVFEGKLAGATVPGGYVLRETTFSIKLRK